jgi:nitrogenase-stabilizing/protective protein
MTTFVDRLRSLSAAEDFFAALEVPFVPRVLEVHRLHILKGFHDALRGVDLESLDDAAAKALMAETLAKVYQAFADGAPPPPSFKVFRRQDEAFVPLTVLSSR